jgi:2,3-dihydroxy-p-cumate/2,3-dihydroxybenzoate 3,4-dioxygenase
MTPHPIRYARLGYAHVQVTSLDASIAFYRDIVGLMIARREDGLAWLRCSDKPYDLILSEGAVPGLATVGFELDDMRELESAYTHIASLGYAPKWTSEAAAREQQVGAAFRFRNPDTGLEIDLFTGQAVAADPYIPTVAKIARLGHVVLNVKSYEDAHRFWIDHLGFSISDHVPSKISFLRCWPNPLHHTLALL